MFSREIINKLQAKRRETFQQYDAITLNQRAVKVFRNLFINPDCQADIDFATLTEPKVNLATLGDHIITAGPSTVAQYANKHKLMHITDADLLRCFALDHAADVHHNHVADKTNTIYAYAHILHVSRVMSVADTEGYRTAELESHTTWAPVRFMHVFIPEGMVVKKGQYVYHHFGVIVAHAHDEKEAASITMLQKSDEFISELARSSAHKRIMIDFADVGIFQKNVLGQMMKPQTVAQVKRPQDLQHGKIKFQR